MCRFARDEHGAFEVLLARYREPIFGFLYRYLGRSDKAEDVFQDVFFEVIRARRSYRAGFKFSAWIFRIARNRAVDRLRRDGFREMVSLQQPLDPQQEEGEGLDGVSSSPYPNPEETALGRELREALEETLERLPAEQREVLWLKEYSGLKIPQVAKLLGVPENTVKSRLRYALGKIREELSSRGYEV